MENWSWVSMFPFPSLSLSPNLETSISLVKMYIFVERQKLARIVPVTRPLRFTPLWNPEAPGCNSLVAVLVEIRVVEGSVDLVDESNSTKFHQQLTSARGERSMRKLRMFAFHRSISFPPGYHLQWRLESHKNSKQNVWAIDTLFKSVSIVLQIRSDVIFTNIFFTRDIYKYSYPPSTWTDTACYQWEILPIVMNISSTCGWTHYRHMPKILPATPFNESSYK